MGIGVISFPAIMNNAATSISAPLGTRVALCVEMPGAGRLAHGHVYVWLQQVLPHNSAQCRRGLPPPRPPRSSFHPARYHGWSPATVAMVGLCAGLRCRLSLPFAMIKDMKHLSMCSVAIWRASLAYSSIDGSAPFPDAQEFFTLSRGEPFPPAYPRRGAPLPCSPVPHSLPLRSLPFGPVSEISASL